MDLRAGSPAVERRTWSRSLRGPILAGPSPSCAHDDDRLRFPPVSPADCSRLDLCFSPTSINGFLLGTEPAFPSALVDLGLVVVALSRHMVDALAAGADVALDHARGSLLLQLH